jgi:hypothetical protein
MLPKVSAKVWVVVLGAVGLAYTFGAWLGGLWKTERR